MPDWTLVRSFLAVVRRGSLSAAARATGQTQPTIGRHVAQFEVALGITLFTRSPSGLIPTDAARTLVSHAETMESAMAALERTASSGNDIQSPSGTVRISASEIMGVAALPPMLRRLRFQHPGVVIELVLNNRTDDLLRRRADIAVRMVRPVQDGLVARKIGEISLRFYAHRDYVDRFGAPDRIDDLRKFHVIGFDRDDHSARSVATGKLDVSRDLFGFRCDNDTGQLAALKAGLGIGVIQSAIARTDPDLVEVLPNAVKLKLECWLCTHEDQRDQPVIRATMDALADGLRQWVDDA